MATPIIRSITANSIYVNDVIIVDPDPDILLAPPNARLPPCFDTDADADDDGNILFNLPRKSLKNDITLRSFCN